MRARGLQTPSTRSALRKVCALALITAVPACSKPMPLDGERETARPRLQARSIDRLALEKAIAAAASYLEHAVGDDGRFVYRVNTDPGTLVAPRYNMLRHAGTIWSMCDAHGITRNAEQLSAAVRAADFLRSHIAPIEAESGAQAVWSDPAISHRNHRVQAKLGGSGLGLAALLALNDHAPGTTPLAELQGLGAFLVYMQEPDGRFVSKYIPSRGGKDDSWQSLYYPGEAALGLVMLHEADPRSGWLEPAIKALLYLAESRRGAPRVPPDHWALIATARALPHIRAEASLLPVETEHRLVHHARQIVDAMLREHVRFPEGDARDGGFTADGRITPAATRLEGLQAAMKILPDGDPRREAAQSVIDQGISFLLRAQIDSGPHRGAWTRAVKPREGAPAGFDRRATEIRIDYVQHSLSVLVNAKNAESSARAGVH